jgi:hypothetical protein
LGGVTTNRRIPEHEDKLLIFFVAIGWSSKHQIAFTWLFFVMTITKPKENLYPLAT